MLKLPRLKPGKAFQWWRMFSTAKKMMFTPCRKRKVPMCGEMCGLVWGAFSTTFEVAYF
jgi:hypothetical protein